MFLVQFIPFNSFTSFIFSYAEYVVVKDVNNLVKVPDSLSLEVAATLPTGALTALNTIMRTRPLLYDKAKRKNGKKTEYTFIDGELLNITMFIACRLRNSQTLSD